RRDTQIGYSSPERPFYNYNFYTSIYGSSCLPLISLSALIFFFSFFSPHFCSSLRRCIVTLRRPSCCTMKWPPPSLMSSLLRVIRLHYISAAISPLHAVCRRVPRTAYQYHDSAMTAF